MDADFTIMRRRMWLLMNGFQCTSLISAALELFKLVPMCQMPQYDLILCLK